MSGLFAIKFFKRVHNKLFSPNFKFMFNESDNVWNSIRKEDDVRSGVSGFHACMISSMDYWHRFYDELGTQVETWIVEIDGDFDYSPVHDFYKNSCCKIACEKVRLVSELSRCDVIINYELITCDIADEIMKSSVVCFPNIKKWSKYKETP